MAQMTRAQMREILALHDLTLQTYGRTARTYEIKTKGKGVLVLRGSRGDAVSFILTLKKGEASRDDPRTSDRADGVTQLQSY